MAKFDDVTGERLDPEPAAAPKKPAPEKPSTETKPSDPGADTAKTDAAAQPAESAPDPVTEPPPEPAHTTHRRTGR